MAVNTPETFQLRLFDFGTKKKLVLILCTAILWVGALIAYFTPGFDYWLVASFSSLRANYMFAGFWYYYTKYMLYVVGFPLIIIYIASFKVNKLKPYRLVLLLAIMTSAIGNPLIDPILKDFIARPRPFVTHLDLNNLYFANGFSFPSGHSFQAFANTLPLIICFLTNDKTFKRNWKKIVLALVLLVYAITLAFSRIIVGVHYLSDMLFGIGIAIILMVILASLLQWLLKKDYLNLQNEKGYALVFLTMTIMNTIFIY
ncbi:phosphatase PAP2 family protein [uncultured Methanobacterium sp.]|uniref:phosphatase PAP2 family protein n=1 Tax=uncultured Methanobacterium sp. TaxID=176306 RepID=UPI002AA90D78|nr:phosphatase PAP2 family protein [uncultured Methanobacterium sp.]